MADRIRSFFTAVYTKSKQQEFADDGAIAQQSAAPPQKPFEKNTVAEELPHDRGLGVGGKKAELVARLEGAATVPKVTDAKLPNAKEQISDAVILNKSSNMPGIKRKQQESAGDGATAQQSAAVPQKPFGNMTVAELKRELHDRGLGVGGIKSKLLMRLEEAAAALKGIDDSDTNPPSAKKQKNDAATAATKPKPVKKGDKPTMLLLIQFVIPKIVDKWKTVAYALEYDIPSVKSMEKECHSDPTKCCEHLFEDWLSTDNGKTPKTWNVLLTTMIVDCNIAKDLIEEMKKQIGCK